ncbi:hypothetical protein CSV61_16045 [Sporosarcina sp. P3]|uniref:hypothetical protein n=1 Tax=Sporosarcina sp. P3 TaxID=2048245 RepID=UPI000C171F9E|nr:hypothetical protein [Sporosarcina sp. P3]PID20160.1 hypothetical protein CSV61_16045 [Sporosarcina sp. P3]
MTKTELFNDVELSDSDYTALGNILDNGEGEAVSLLKAFALGQKSVAKNSGIKQFIEVFQVFNIFDIAEMLENALVKDQPYTLYELQKDGSNRPQQVSREYYLDFIMNSAMEGLYGTLENFVDDEGNFILTEEERA